MSHLQMGKSSVKVLMVEDDQEITLSTIMCLRAQGFRPEYVANGREALEWVKENGHPDIILLDLQMPIMGGEEFMSEYQGPAAIVVTTARDHYELPRAPFDTLAKPYKVLDVIDSIDRAVEANGGPLWTRLLPCKHKCIGVDIKGKELTLTCLVPTCNKSTVADTDKIDFNTVLELTMALAEDASAREESTALS